MKSKIALFSIAILSAATFSACSTGSASKPGTDSTGRYVPTNAYRDTFANTSSYGNAATIDNSGSGGTGIAKPKASLATDHTSVEDLPASQQPAAAAPADTTKK